jgi:hypothetical protein
MPTFDGGHYFLTVLVPVRTDLVATQDDDGVATSAVHALRKRLSLLPTAAQSDACLKGQSPFARNKRNHFVRLVVIDDVAYNGRVSSDTLFNAIRGTDLTAAQPQDHLSCPFLLFVADIDAESGDAKQRDSYLIELWNTMGEELRDVFQYCVAFTSRVQDAASFSKYIADCQLETTMSFNDYYPVSGTSLLNLLPMWPDKVTMLGFAAASAAVIAVGFFAPSALAWVVAAALAAIVYLAYRSVMAAGAEPFPPSGDAKLPAVLKALYLQHAFTRFAIDNQITAAAAAPGKDGKSDSAAAQELYDNFAGFIAQYRPNDLEEPTQEPGVILL